MKRTILSTLTLITLLSSCALLAGCEVESKSQPSQPSIALGSEKTLSLDGAAVFLTVDENTYDEFYKAMGINDDEGAKLLILSGKAFSVEAGTRVRVIDSGFSKYTTGHDRYKVRVLQGKDVGKAGWVPPNCLR
jgi:hypothetical protein